MSITTTTDLAAEVERLRATCAALEEEVALHHQSTELWRRFVALGPDADYAVTDQAIRLIGLIDETDRA